MEWVARRRWDLLPRLKRMFCCHGHNYNNEGRHGGMLSLDQVRVIGGVTDPETSRTNTVYPMELI